MDTATKTSTKSMADSFDREFSQMESDARKHLEGVKKAEKDMSPEVAAAVGLKDTTTGDTLCDEKNQVILEKMVFPEPVIELAIEPKSKADQEKMSIALQKLAKEDPYQQ